MPVQGEAKEEKRLSLRIPPAHKTRLEELSNILGATVIEIVKTLIESLQTEKGLNLLSEFMEIEGKAKSKAIREYCNKACHCETESWPTPEDVKAQIIKEWLENPQPLPTKQEYPGVKELCQKLQTISPLKEEDLSIFQTRKT